MTRAACDNLIFMGRRSLLVFLGSVFLSNSEEEATKVIYARESWYRERPETEQDWSGVLRRRQVHEGPASRTALRFTLNSARRSIPVYAAGAIDKLTPFTDRRVTARAKLVNLRNEGYGDELWIGTIRAAP